MARQPKADDPFRWLDSSPEVIQLVVMLYVRYPLSLRNVEDLAFERGIEHGDDPSPLRAPQGLAAGQGAGQGRARQGRRPRAGRPIQPGNFGRGGVVDRSAGEAASDCGTLSGSP